MKLLSFEFIGDPWPASTCAAVAPSSAPSQPTTRHGLPPTGSPPPQVGTPAGHQAGERRSAEELDQCEEMDLA